MRFCSQVRPGVLETGTVDEYDGRHPQKVNQKKKEKENLHEYQYFNKRIKRTRSVELSDRGYPRRSRDFPRSHSGALAMKTEEIETSDAIDRTKKTIICCRRGAEPTQEVQKSIWSKFTKAINTYELVKPGTKSQSAFPAEKIRC